MSFLWATRGRTWGFRFLRDGGFADPLPVYDLAFSGAPDEPEVWHRVPGTAAGGELGALRFPDPVGRQDRAGRTIPHDFVLLRPLVGEIASAHDGLRLVWPLVADEFARVWDLPEPPSSTAG